VSPKLQESQEYKILEKQLAGALKTAISAHGPITKDMVGSAVRRQATQLIAFYGEKRWQMTS